MELCAFIDLLQAVLTHKGRSSNSGHYVAWVKKDGFWSVATLRLLLKYSLATLSIEYGRFCCDDDRVYPVPPEDIERLSGGGDWHTAYILLYAPKQVCI